LALFVLRKTTKTSTKMVNFCDEIWNREVRKFSASPKRNRALGTPEGTGEGKEKSTLHEYGLRL